MDLGKLHHFTEQEYYNFLKSGGFISLSEKEMLIFWGEQKKSSQYLQNRVALYSPDFFLSVQEPWIYFEKTAVIRRDDMAIFCDSVEKICWDWQEPDSSEFLEYFAKIQQEFKEGLKKAVPVVFARSSQKIDLKTKSAILSHLFKKSAEDCKHYDYGYWDEDLGIIGSTPEVLFATENKDCKTMALAGTSRPGVQQSLLENSKEMYEHELVVQGIQASLSSFGQLQVGQTEEVHFKNINHLKTEINLVGAEMDFEQIVEALHPTPALGTSPKKMGPPLLKEICNINRRRRFGAPFGFKYNDKAICLVAIRNIQWDQKYVDLGSGCGIVPQSEFDLEWNELHLKRQTVKENLGL